MRKHLSLIGWLCLGCCPGFLPSQAFSRQLASVPRNFHLEEPTNLPGDYKVVAALIKGRITSATGEPLLGVTVLVKGTSTGTSTDADGTFTLTSPENKGTLVVSFIGYTTKEVSFNGPSNLDIPLTEDPKAKAMKEVVVVGYGTQRKRDVTGAVASIKASEIQNIPVPSVEALMQGRAAGVQVNPNSGVPGAGISVRIRGAASISGGNDPLYVVDGVPMKGEFGSAVGQGRNEVSPMADINPNDIESIEILKDASSAAIYGARAANGVVLITTKRGKANKTTVNLNYSTGFQSRPLKYTLLSGNEFKEYYTQAHANVGLTPAVNLSAEGYDTVNTDWQDALFRKAPVSSYDVSFSGGNEKTRFALSVGYFDQEGIIINTGYKRLSSRLNLDHEISKKLRVGASISYTKSETKRIQGDDAGVAVFLRTLIMPPVVPITNENGSYHFSKLGLLNINPFSVAKELKNIAYSNRGIANLYGEYDILKGLKLRVSAGGDLLFLNESYFNNSRVFLAANISANEVNVQDFSWINENVLTYDKSFGDDHKLTFLAGYSQQQTNYTFVRANGSGFAADDIQTINAAAVTTSSSNKTSNGIESLFSRINYSLKDRYLFTANLRRDASSRFPAKRKYATFPSVSAGWRISDEPFMQRFSNLSDLKLRVAIGEVGNQNIGDFRYLGSYTSSNNYLGRTGAAPADIVNPDLSWETTLSYDVGLDLSLFNNRVTFTTDFYLKETRDLLLAVALPVQSGFGSSLQNIGSVENKGMEFSLSTVNLDGALKWNTNFNIAFNRNKITQLNSDDARIIVGASSQFNIGSPPSIGEVGLPLGTLLVYVYDGVYSTAKEIPPSIKAQNMNINAGDVRFKDLNNDGLITEDDRQIFSVQPKFIGGITNNFSYKSFDLNVFGQFVYGNKVYNTTVAGLTGTASAFNQLPIVRNRWQKEGDVTDIPRYAWGDPGGNRKSSTRYLEDGSYFRIKVLSLGYTLPSNLTSRARLNRLRIYATSTNLLTFTKYTGMDPDVNNVGGGSDNPIQAGVDHGSYPSARTFIFGINLGL